MITRDRAHRVLAAGICVGVVLLLNLQFLEARRAADRRVGIFLEDAEQGVLLSDVVAGSPAERAGLRPKDRLTAINGVPIRRSADYDGVAEGFRRGERAEYRITRDGQERTLAVFPGMPVRWIRHLAVAVGVLGYLGLALLTLAQPQRDLRGMLLFLFAGAVAVELALPGPGIGAAALTHATTAVFFLLTGIEIGLELHLVSLIPARPPFLVRRRWIVPLYYAVGMAIGLTLCATYLADSFSWGGFPWSYSQALGVLNIGIMPTWAIAVVGLLTYQALTYAEPLGRHQAALVLTGDVPWAVLIVVTAVLEATRGGGPGWLDLVEPPVLLCLPVAVFVAIFRYHLFDIELVVRRGMVYTALTGTLVLVFYATVGAGSALFSRWVGGGVSVLVISAATLLLGLLFSPLRTWLQRIIDRRFFPERYAQRQRLVALAAELPIFGKVPLMGKHLVAKLREIFAVREATLLVAEPESRVLVTVASTKLNPERDFDQSFLLSPDDPGVQFLRRSRRPLPASQLNWRSASLAQRLQVFDASLVVPVISHEELIGLLLLGEKQGATGFQREEVELLSLLSHHVATVFENARLFESATTDSLTGLLRRETVLAHLERELQRAIRYDRPLAAGMADLDHFKDINDRHGHLAGDTLLKRVAQALSAGLRSADLIGRYGGEEFLFILPESDLEGARVVAEKIRVAIERIRLRMDDGSTLRVSISIGLATLAELGSDATISAQALIAAADRNLLRAKAAGRNRIESGAPPGAPM